jgi:hypothetical protein
MEKNRNQEYYLDCEEVQRVSVKHQGSSHFLPLHHGVIELSSRGFHFEKEGGPDFRPEEDVKVRFDLKDRAVDADATVRSVDRWTPWDESFSERLFHHYRVEFKNELDEDSFRRLAGCRKRCED